MRLFVVLVVLLALSLLAGTASGAETTAHVEGGTVEAETTFELRAPGESLNYWTVSVTLPDGATVVSVEDSMGEIEGYEVEDDTLEFETNTGVARDSETVTVGYRVEDAVVEVYEGLTLVEVGIVGFEGTAAADTETRATVTSDESVLSASAEHGFERSVNGNEAVYEGEGSATVRVAVGDGEETENYAVFGDDTDLSEADELYRLVPAAFGFETSVHKHPVVVLGDDEYNETADRWSNGQYRTGGVVLLRASADDATEAVLHETAHAYNAEALVWSDEKVGWFDEGTSEYVEFLADRTRNQTRRALFVGDRIRDGSRVGPRGSVDELLGYYAEGSSIRSWTPSEADDERRRFGYAFSELVVRSYVERNGASALRRTYDGLLSADRSATASQEATDVVLGSMREGGDVLRPCAAPSRSEAVDCLRRVNKMDATVPAYDGVSAQTYEFDPSSVPDGRGAATDDNRTDEGTPTDGQDGTEAGEGNENEDRDGGGLLSALGDLLSGVVEFLRGLLR